MQQRVRAGWHIDMRKQLRLAITYRARIVRGQCMNLSHAVRSLRRMAAKWQAKRIDYLVLN